MARFTDLPCEILWLVVDSFSQRDLHACTFINKQCYTALNPLLWHYRQLLDGDTVDTILDTATIVRRPDDSIQQLKLYNDYWTDARLFVLIETGLDQLEQVCLLRTSKLTDAGVVYLCRRSPHLRKVSLLQVPIRQRSMDALGRLPLTKLDINECQHIETYAALQHCPLQSLHLAHILETEMAIWDLMIHCSHLVDLTLDLSPQFMTTLFAEAAGAWPHLTTLTIHHYVASTRDPLIDFLEYHPDLQHLSICNTTLADTLMDQLIGLRLPLLDTLVMTDTHIHGPKIRRLVHAWPSLTYVKFWGCGIRPDSGITSRSRRLCRSSHHLHHLDHHDIANIRFGLPSALSSHYIANLDRYNPPPL